jgi:hypothetical protein
MKKSKMSLAVGATVAALALPLSVHGASVDDLSAQLQAMQSQMMEMQKELQSLREKDAARAGIVVVENDYGALQEEVMYLREDVDDLDDRLMEPERHAALDRIEWGGDFRFQAHSIDSTIPDHINGLQMQGDFIGFLQDFNMLGDQFTFEELSAAMEGLQAMIPNLPPEQQEFFQQQMAALAQQNYVKGYNFNDDVVRTIRPPGHVQGVGRLHRGADFQWPAHIDQLGRQPDHLPELRRRHSPGAGLLHLEPDTGYRRLPFNRSPSFHRGRTGQLPQRRASRRYAHGLPVQLPV